MCGRDVHDAIPDIILNHVRDLLPRSFESFSQAAAECAASRIFLGIHWYFDATDGIRLGSAIAQDMVTHGFQLQSTPEPTGIALALLAVLLPATITRRRRK